MYGTFAQKFHWNFIKFLPKLTFSYFYTQPYWKAFEIDTRWDKNFTFGTPKSQIFTFSIRVRRICSKMDSQIHDLVSNDPILDSKVVPDELGQLAEPGRPGLASEAARSCRRGPGWPPPGGPVGCFPGRERGKSSGGGRSAQELMEPPHSYHRRWVIW